MPGSIISRTFDVTEGALTVSKRVVKNSLTLYFIYRIYKVFVASDSIEEILDKISIRRLINLLKDVLPKGKQNDADLTIDEALRKLNISDLKKKAFNSAKKKLKLKMDKTESIPGIELKIPNPLNFIGGLVSSFIGRRVRNDDHSDQIDQIRLIRDLLKESKEFDQDEEIEDYIKEIIDEYSQDND